MIIYPIHRSKLNNDKKPIWFWILNLILSTVFGIIIMLFFGVMIVHINPPWYGEIPNSAAWIVALIGGCIVFASLNSISKGLFPSK